MEPGCYRKSNTNNLPAPTYLTKNPYGEKKLFYNDATQKSARVVRFGIAIESVPREPIFEKCPHLREKGGVLTLRTPRWVCADPYSIYTAYEVMCGGRARSFNIRSIASTRAALCFILDGR
jgi:hypothetical protein